jgi:hypothetical protein
MFQRTIARAGCLASGNEHNPKALSQSVLVLAHNFSQTAPNTITNDCASDATRSNKAYAAWARILYWHHIGYQEFAASRKPVAFHALIF